MKFPYAEVEFESTGALHDPAQRDAAANMLASSGATDLLVLVHGWNNDMPAARRLYQRLSDHIDAVWPHVPAATGRELAIVGVLWPSIRWSETDEIAAGGAGLGDDLLALLSTIDETIEDPARSARLRELAPALDTSTAARAEFLSVLRDQMPPPPAGDEDPPPPTLIEGSADEAFQKAEMDTMDIGIDAGVDVGPGGAAGFDLRGFLRSARNLLNLTTYYTMKDRAGQVGAVGVAGLLTELGTRVTQTRHHLVGHSFGARVVAATAVDAPAVHSLTLLQGAFSHHGFAHNYDGQGHDGHFRAVVAPAHLTGPIVVTHTVNDTAVGRAYAIASRLAGQEAAGLGGPDDQYGGIGRNGALRTPEVVPTVATLEEVGFGYGWQPAGVHNLRADAYIRDHGDVSSPQVAYALLSAVASG